MSDRPPASQAPEALAVRVEGLVKRYGEFVALDGLELAVPRGEIFGLLGPNGSGKTTAINCILQLLTYDRGTIELFGEPMEPVRYDLKSRVGVVPQQVAVFDELTVYENVDYLCSLYVADRSRRRALVDRALDFVDLTDYARMRPRKLSGGLQRRLNIACGIAHEPELVFFDEPTVAVDPQSRASILDGICRLRQAGATVVYTSHYMEEVEQICDRVMIMDKGRRLALGTPDELKRSTGAGERVCVGVGQLADARAERLAQAVVALPCVRTAALEGDELRLVCDPGEHNLADVLAELRRSRVTPGRITCEPPTLNDVFLQITGRELRD